MFYSQTFMGLTNLAQAWTHNLVSNASASGVSLFLASMVPRINLVNASNTVTGIPVIVGHGSNVLTASMNGASTLTTCSVEVQVVHSITL